jgi:hypothetical protein
MSEAMAKMFSSGCKQFMAESRKVNGSIFSTTFHGKTAAAGLRHSRDPSMRTLPGWRFRPVSAYSDQGLVELVPPNDL